MTLNRFLTRLIWVCAAPLVLLSLYLAAMHVRALSIQQNREAMDRVRNVATALDNNLGARIAALQVLSGSPFLDEPFRLNEFYRIAQAYQKYFGAHIVVADTSSQALLNTRVPFGTPLAKLPVPKGRSAVALTLATGKPAVGDLFYGPVAKQQLVALTAPVIRNGSVKALLLCTIEVQQLKKRLDQEALPDSWSLALFDSSDTLMTRRSLATVPVVSDIPGVPGHFMTRLATVPWAVVLDVPHDVYRKPLFAAAGALAVAIGIVTLVSIAGGGLAGRRLSRAVATLTQTLTPPGNGTALAEIEAVRDILQRASAARDASEQALRDSKEQLRLAAISLEQRVKERTAELQMANHELEAFSYSVSHDLRAPLRAIDGFSLAVLEDYGNQLDDEGRTYLERVRKASQRMAHLIDDLLQLSRIGRSELNYVTVDLSAIAREVADEFNAQDPQRRVVWQLEEGICLQADANLMRIVMVNLLGNAWKFSAPRAEAQISFGRTVWQGQPALYVSDNGAGFEMQYADRLFQPFQRLHAETEFPGTGIGLAIVQRIIHRHNGTVAAEGEPGQGARFYFSVGGAHARGQDNSAG